MGKAVQYAIPEKVAKDMSPEQLAAAKNAISLLNTMISSGMAQPAAAAPPGEGEQAGQAGAPAPGGDRVTREGVTDRSERIPNEEEGAGRDKDPEEGADEATRRAQTVKVTKKMAGKIASEIMKALVPGGESEVDQGKAGKGASPEDDIATASGNAEERLSDIPEFDEENVKEVAKFLGLPVAQVKKMRLAARSQRVAKSAELDEVNQKLDTVTKALEGMIGAIFPNLARESEAAEAAMTAERGTTDLAESRVFKGDQGARTVGARRPVGSTDSDKVYDMVAKGLADAFQRAGIASGGPAERRVGDGAPLSNVRKEMPSLLQLMAARAGNLWGPIW